MNYKSLLIYTLFFQSFFLIAGQSEAKKEAKPTEMVILHINDMHSKIDNLGKLAFLVDSLKKSHPYVFLVSAGDNFTGNPIVDMYPDPGYPLIDLMNMVGFKLSALGNHEFDLGQELHNKRRSEAKFPFICANMDVGSSKVKQPKPFFILKAGKEKIPVLGLIQLGENGLPDSHPSKLQGLKFVPAIEKAQEFMRLKDKYGSLVALTHLGVEDDEPLAQKYPQIDLIIGGHSHTLIAKPMMVNNVMIVQTGSGLRSVGKTTLKVEKGKITDRNYELISLASVKGTRADVQLAIDRYNDNEEMNKTVGIAEKAVNNDQELGCMMTDAITHQYGLDFAFQNSGGVRIPFLPAGDIKYRDIFRLDPFGNQVVEYTMTIPEIKSLILYSFNRNKEIDFFASGMNYSVVVDETGTGVDVEIRGKTGSPVDQDKKYKVGMNSYIGASYKFDHSDPGTARAETTAQTLIDYLKEVKSVNYEGVKRVSVRKK